MPRIHLALLGAAAAVLLGSGVAATAADTVQGTTGQFTYLTDGVTVPSGQPATIEVDCPTDTHIVGMGFNANDSSPGTLVNSVAPIDSADAGSAPDDGVVVRVFNGNPSSSAFASAYAVCSTVKPLYTVGSKVVSAHQLFTARALCGTINGNPTYVAGGGEAALVHPNSVRLVAGAPADNQSDVDSVVDNEWKTTIYNRTARDQTVTFYAACWPTDTLEYAAFPGMDPATGNAGFNCPTSTSHGLSAGLSYTDSPPAIGFWDLGAVPSDGADSDSAPDDGFAVYWRVTDPDAASNSVTAYAICKTVP